MLTVLLFTDFGLQGASYIAVFALIYVAWGLAYTANDISYWSMLPSLSLEQKEREQIGSVARICANIGLFSWLRGLCLLPLPLEMPWEACKRATLPFHSWWWP